MYFPLFVFSLQELPPQPTVPVPVSDYEQVRIARMNENQKRMEELGVKKLAAVMKPCASNKRKGKDKVQEGGDDYNPEDESEDTSVETTEVIKYIMSYYT